MNLMDFDDALVAFDPVLGLEVHRGVASRVEANFRSCPPMTMAPPSGW